MLSYRDFIHTFQALGLQPSQPVMVHMSLSAFGEVRGGAETVLGALLSVTDGVMAPSFTDKTMITPEVGPPDNAILYGSGKDQNRMAEFFHPKMPVDPTMGVFPEVLRSHPKAHRSCHPILSFTGVCVDQAIDAQTIEEPLAPIRVLTEDNGMVLLVGVNHSVNTSIHYAELLAGRKQFVRWALTAQGVKQCPGFPGCSEGFEQASPYLSLMTQTAKIGSATLRLLPLAPMIMTLTDLLQNDPTALLCHNTDCLRCEAVRRSIKPN